MRCGPDCMHLLADTICYYIKSMKKSEYGHEIPQSKIVDLTPASRGRDKDNDTHTHMTARIQ